ncbi:unnamed protein product [Rotaria sordida]|uniref:PDZ domain-containing protein n=1 Tax=Rotaria sordida TaxID=392033 RepID=A0A819S953_9BILA|nr:unnamed protein product [Rotaria sordida]CAF0859039.1 unnamed protein product [Rotaria sordida]CAF0864090.1 unnamed protein product [Rotaria sordida]CAF1008082.1 unnamed protein product [Rotaria sordida]CAF1196279.1 unnamed protein product [Rotaria sordida]
MITTTNPWHLFRQQLMQIEDIRNSSILFEKNEKSMRNIIHDHHWIEFDIDILMNTKIHNKICSLIRVNELNHSIIVTNILNNNKIFHPFDIILSFNDINFINMTKKIAQRIIKAHQGQIVKMRIRRLQPPILETIELNLRKHNFIKSRKLGFTINGGIDNNNNNHNNDPGLFVIDIKPKSPAANNGRLRIGDRLIEIRNTYITVNLQYIEFEVASKLIKRMRKESTSITLVVAHQT